ncbi:HAMP domain-containing protein [Streptomyces sp. NBC_01005]|nr:HAMP domain-containing protein [Streptomyces sp. NBC_01005]WTC99276.1 HAMP domain-containing protein [Streptomyces sp. NBC_01650]
MRWALVRVCLAVTVMVVVAFAVPLGLVVKEMASDRAFSNAERQAAAIGPTLSITTDREQLSRAMLSTDAGLEGRMALHIPADDGASELEIGRGRAVHDELDAIRELGRSGISKVPGGSALLAPIALDSAKISIVEVYVPDADVTNGVTTAWIVLAGVGIALVIGSVAVADRLGVRLTQPAERLAGAAHELGEGMLGVRVPEDGPTELKQAAAAFNSMADQVVQLLANERELAADLSHRLRTPLTVLRLNAASLGHGPDADQTRAAVEQLEREVDTIIRTAREDRPRTAGAVPAGTVPGRRRHHRTGPEHRTRRDRRQQQHALHRHRRGRRAVDRRDGSDHRRPPPRTGGRPIGAGPPAPSRQTPAARAASYTSAATSISSEASRVVP